MIKAEKLSKTFTVHKKAPGLMGSMKSLIFREKIQREAVKGATFEVHEGEIVGLVGANGAGKTTLVKMLAGIRQAATRACWDIARGNATTASDARSR